MGAMGVADWGVVGRRGVRSATQRSAVRAPSHHRRRAPCRSHLRRGATRALRASAPHSCWLRCPRPQASSLVHKVLRYLRVHGMRRVLERRDEEKARRAAHRKVLAEQRAYLETATALMAVALHENGAHTARAELQRTRQQRQQYIEPAAGSVAELRAQLRRQREIEYERQHAKDESHRAATYGGPGRAVLGHAATASASRALTAAPAHRRGDALGRPSGGYADPAAHPSDARPRFQPRVDLQCAPRNWPMQPPPATPVSSLPSVRGTYETPLWSVVVPPPPMPPSPRRRGFSSASPRVKTASPRLAAQSRAVPRGAAQPSAPPRGVQVHAATPAPAPTGDGAPVGLDASAEGALAAEAAVEAPGPEQYEGSLAVEHDASASVVATGEAPAEAPPAAVAADQAEAAPAAVEPSLK